MRFRGERVRIVLHELDGRTCGCGGSWSAPAARTELGNVLAAVLDEAIEDGHITSNPARGRRMKVHVPKPRRSFLEVDELTALLTAASEQDGLLHVPADEQAGETARAVARLLSRGLRPAEVAERLDLSRSTVTFHAQRLGARVVGRGYAGRRVVCETLGRTGVRASELCAVRIGHVRLHDPDGARFGIPDSKTETGIREVQMAPALVEAVVDHLDRLQRAGRSTTPTTTWSRAARAIGSRASGSARSSSTPPTSPPSVARPRACRRCRRSPARPAPDLHLDRPARQPVRREVGDEPGRPRRLADDDERLRPVGAASRPVARGELRSVVGGGRIGVLVPSVAINATDRPRGRRAITPLPISLVLPRDAASRRSDQLPELFAPPSMRKMLVPGMELVTETRIRWTTTKRIDPLDATVGIGNGELGPGRQRAWIRHEQVLVTGSSPRHPRIAFWVEPFLVDGRDVPVCALLDDPVDHEHFTLDKVSAGLHIVEVEERATEQLRIGAGGQRRTMRATCPCLVGQDQELFTGQREDRVGSLKTYVRLIRALGPEWIPWGARSVVDRDRVVGDDEFVGDAEASAICQTDSAQIAP